MQELSGPYENAHMTNAATLARHIAAENARDVHGIVDTFAQDGALVLNGETFRGHERIFKVHDRFGFGPGGGSFADIRVEELRRFETPTTIVVEERLSARHVGTWDGVAATGRSFAVSLCAVYEFDADHLLVSERVYFDGAGLMKQLGR